MSLVSIITPSYNSSPFISNTLKSVASQSFDNWEMIIVDDYSSDNSAEVIQQYASQDPRIKFIQLEKNSGAAVARNTAIEASDRKSTRLNSSHVRISYAVFCLK